jgi:hypothetical protein
LSLVTWYYTTYAVATATAFFRLRQDPAGRQETFISFVLAALPPERTKKTVLSLLPQAKHARYGASSNADCLSRKTIQIRLYGAASPHHQTKKKSSSLLPQARKAIAA